MKWFLLVAAFIVVAGRLVVPSRRGAPSRRRRSRDEQQRIIALLDPTNKNRARGARTRPALGKSDSSTPAGGAGRITVEVTTNSDGDIYRHRWEQRELEAKRRAFIDIIGGIDVDREIKEALWREYRKAESSTDYRRAFDIILKGTDWVWPWLDECRAALRKNDDKLTSYARPIYEGPPTEPSTAEELAPLLSVAEMREFLKQLNQYPKPAPRKRTEFEALINAMPWSDLQPLARKVFKERGPALQDEYERDRVDLLATTLGSRAYAERRFEDYREFGRVSTIIPDETVFAAKEALRFSRTQDRPLPPFYPGDMSRVSYVDQEVRSEAMARLKDVAIKKGEDPSVFSERAYKAHWINAREAAENNDYSMARKWFAKAGMALHGLSGREGEKQQLKDEAARALRRDPAYIIATADIKKLISQRDDLLQKDIYDLLPYTREDIGQVLYFAAENGDIVRTKSGRTYKLSLPAQK